MLNDLLLQSGAMSWKPVLTALLLPPLPLLLVMLLGAALARRRSAWGGLLLLAGAAGIWLSCTTSTALENSAGRSSSRSRISGNVTA